jgi:membrane-associated phospholipid phosphatase
LSRVTSGPEKRRGVIPRLESSPVHLLVEHNTRRRAGAGSAEPGVVTGWLIAGLLLLLAAFALTIVAAGDGTVPGDTALALAVQRPASEEIDTIARGVSLVGDDFPAMVALTLVGFLFLTSLGRRDLALFLAAAAALRAIGPSLKRVTSSPRPSAETIMVVAQADGSGFPSGHAMGAALFYGAIAVIAPQVVGNRLLARGIQIGAFVTMGLIALSRVRLGVHWPTDVAGGLLFGLAIVCLLRAGMLAYWVGRPKP